MAREFKLETSDGLRTFTTDSDEVSHLDTTTSKENADIIALLLETWTCLIADSPLIRATGSKKPFRVFSTFRRGFLGTPLKEFVMRHARLADRIVASTQLFGSGSSTGDWIPEMRDTPVFREYHTWYRTGDPALLQYLLTFLYFGKKTKYVDPEMNATAFRGWLEVEEKLSGLSLDNQVLAVLKRIVTGLVPEFVDVPLVPKFGPGAVAEKGIRGRIGKSNNLDFDPKIDRVLFRGHYCSYGLKTELGYSVDAVIPDPRRWIRAKSVSSRVSELRFVPKDVTKSRSICMEPNTYMFAQQAVLRRLLASMNKGPARRFVNISDQSRNRDLARYGSYSSELDTIDLSSASDSVSVDLVKGIFPREILYHLLGTRTSKVRTVDGSIVDVKKFAPMGSALCFPVQCLVFTSVVVYAAILHAHGKAVGDRVPMDSPWLDNIDRTTRRLFQRRCRYVLPGRKTYEPAAVYGDDICVDAKLTPYVTHLLSSLGFEVNTKKSFTGNQAFRESCGGYYHCGDDVTPLYFRVERYRGKIGPESVASMISLANHAGDRGYRNLRKVLVQRLLFDKLDGPHQLHGVNQIAFSDDRTQSLAVFTTRPRNTHLHTRYNVAWQRDEYRCIIQVAGKSTKASERELERLERYLYLQVWAVERGDSYYEDYVFGASRFDTSGSRLRLGWSPVAA